MSKYYYSMRKSILFVLSMAFALGGLQAQVGAFDLRYYPTQIYDYFAHNATNCIITDGTNVDGLARMLGPNTLIIFESEYNAFCLANYNIICVGTSETNGFIRTLDLPYSFAGGVLCIGDTTINTKGGNFMAVTSNPFNRSNCLLHMDTIVEGYNNHFFEQAQLVVYKKNEIAYRGKYYSHFTTMPVSPNEQMHESDSYPNTQLNRFPNLNGSLSPIDPNIFKPIDNSSNYKELVSDMVNKKVVLLGENHYLKEITHIVKRILFALNEDAYFPYLVVEAPFSYTSDINSFLSIADDKMAAAFFSKRLDKILTTIEDSVFYDDIRVWNRNSPMKKLNVLCSDIEHNYAFTISDILIPKLNNAGFAYFRDSLESANYLRKILPEIKSLHSVDETIYPIIENLLHSLLAYNALNEGFHKFNQIRSKAIINKFEDPRYFGDIVRDNKLIIYGGSEHTGTRNRYAINRDSEGYYFEYNNPYTKGLTYSLRLIAYSYTVNPSLLNKEHFKHRASDYLRMLTSYRAAFESKSLDANDPIFIFNGFDSFTKRLLEISISKKGSFFFSTADIHKFERLNYISYLDMKHSIRNKNHFLLYDGVIVIPTSKLVSSR